MWKTLVCGVAVLAVLAGLSPATAERPYDRKLEKAVMAIVAARIGDIRGSFSYAQAPQLVVARDVPPPARQAPAVPDVAGGEDGPAAAVGSPGAGLAF
jgi:hypothetical protein